MQSDDQYLERTPDLVAKVRAMREAAERQMNRFTRVSDYDVRLVTGHGSKPVPVSPEASVTSFANERPKKSVAKSTSVQPSLEFPFALVEDGDDGKSA